MIKGAINRVSDAPHWDVFKQAERDHPDIIESLNDHIRNNVEGRAQINSTEMGADVLKRWNRCDEWNQIFGDNTSQLFGMVLWVMLFDDEQTWRTSKEMVEGRQVRIYRRA